MTGFDLLAPTTIGEAILWLVVIFIVTFLIGSIPWGVVISKLFYRRDIRKEGSGNIGTTNAMRSLGRVGGVVVFILDFCKGLLSGFLAMWVASWVAQVSPDLGVPAAAYLVNPFGGSDEATLAQSVSSSAITTLCVSVSFLGCVLGHIFCPWLKFKGGKGIAVSIGCLFVLFGPVGAIIELLSFAIVVAVTRYVSAGSLTASVVCPICCLVMFWGEWTAVIIGTITAAFVIWAHHGNIGRLIKHTERRIGAKKDNDDNGEDSNNDNENGSEEGATE